MLRPSRQPLWADQSVKINDTLHVGPQSGLDWFLLDLFLMALIYVPLERLWPQYPNKEHFRREWTLDVVYFMSTHLPLQILSFLVLLPATQATKYWCSGSSSRYCSNPWFLQFFLAVVVADIAEYLFIGFAKVGLFYGAPCRSHSSKALD